MLHGMDEQDTCRICSAPAEPDQPLFYPCKCSGTIRYIHQECLTTWLAHSKKKSCDVCKHPYSFTKVYAPDMPTNLPFVLYIRKSIVQFLAFLVFTLRISLVSLLWLALLPWITVWSWRLYFMMGDSIAWWIAARPDAPSLSLIPVYYNITFYHNMSLFETNETTHGNASLPGTTIWNAISADIFTGQIIAGIIVLSFVALFFLREWIAQNQRMDVDANEGVADVVPPAIPPPQPAVEPIPIPAPDEPVAPPETTDEERPESEADSFASRKRHAAESQGSAETSEYRSARKLRRTASDLSVDRRLRAAYLDSSEHEFVVVDDDDDDGGDAESSRASSWPTGGTGGGGLLPGQGTDYPFTFQIPHSAGQSGELPTLSSSTPIASSSNAPKRPPLPPAEGSPLPSPSLATYRPPEEMEAGPSNLARRSEPSYFDQLDFERERALYFKDPPPDNNEMSFPLEVEADVDGGPGEEQKGDTDDEDADDEAEELQDMDMDIDGDMDADNEMDGEIDDADGEGLGDGELRLRDGRHGGQGAPELRDPDPAHAAEVQELNNDLDGNAEDDLDGALEAVGIRGPLHIVLQNAALIIFILTATMGLVIWLPFTVGRVTALLSLDLQRLFYVALLPIRLIRLFTDPFVDSLILFTQKLISVPFASSIRHLLSKFGFNSFGAGTDLVNTTVTENAPFYSLYWSKISSMVFNMSSKASTPPANWTSFFDTLDAVLSKYGYTAENNSEGIQLFEAYFAPLGRKVRRFGIEFHRVWVNLALGHTPVDRFFAITLGYCVAGFALALYLNALTVGNVRSAGRAVQSAIKQQLIVLKVAAFIMIELLVFPLGCGIMLDVCTLGLLPGSTLDSRIAFLKYAPATAVFYHWVIGTMFMYQFAIILAGCRDIMRKGAMWFIKDPQDQNFQPIRDILDRPTLLQLRKLVVSAVMYAMVIACGVGTVVTFLKMGLKVLPLRWMTREALSEVPVDLLFLHLVLPYTLRYFRPRDAIHVLAVRWWRFAAAQLRLSSYMFGERLGEEEHPSCQYSWQPPFIYFDSTLKNDGSFRRVPASDYVALARDMRGTAEVTEHGIPVDDNARDLINSQNEEARKAGRSVEGDYTVVYIPPHFRQRVLLFIFSLWFVGSVGMVLAIALPIRLGRGVFNLYRDAEVHDGYSFIVGFYLLWACWLVGHTIDRMDKRRQRRGPDGPRPSWTIYMVKRALLWTARISWMVLTLGVIIPTLVAIVVELYIVMQFRRALEPDVTPRLRMVELWSVGLLYTKMLVKTRRLHGHDNYIVRGVSRIRHNGWTRPDPVAATKEVIGPVVGGLLGMILIPPLAAWLSLHLVPNHVNESQIYIRVYPMIFVLVGWIKCCYALRDLVNSWAQSIRDSEFLVEMRLRNLEPQNGAKSKDTTSKQLTAST